MGVLFGDLLVNVHERFQLFVDCRADQPLPPLPDLIPERECRMVIS